LENKQKRIRIAYLTVNDPLDKRSWSGTTYYIAQTLQKNVGEVDLLGPVHFPWVIEKFVRGIAKLERVLFKKNYLAKYSLLKSWYAARLLKKKMAGKQYDCICAPAASTELACLKTDVPVIYISDTTFRLISQYYKQDFSNVSLLSKWEANRLEKKALNKSRAIIYSSEWAAQSAVADYKVSPQKINIAPLGANIDAVPARDIIYEKEKNPELTLLYLAVEWERKGGSIAFETLKILHETYGIKAKLIVCGCIPPPAYRHPYLEVIPFLNKNIREDQQTFVRLLSSAHFLLLPTRADCSLLVACEANAYGIPAITTETGGVPDIVKDGVNGYCVPYTAPVNIYATLVAELFADKEKFHKLITSSRQRFEDELNWDKWADQFKKVYQAFILQNDEAFKQLQHAEYPIVSTL
jgi:glycosyltransferase involved in cell wall biosynthesis